jgi:hypothetical protein
MQSLMHLEIESNYLSGSLPVRLGRLKSGVPLRNATISLCLVPNPALWLDSNSISGRIPTSIDLTELTSLSITNSTLSGAIPTEMARLTKLRRLWLYDNRLSGRIPSLELSALTNLEVVRLYQNKLTGVMPPMVALSHQDSHYSLRLYR